MVVVCVFVCPCLCVFAAPGSRVRSSAAVWSLWRRGRRFCRTNWVLWRINTCRTQAGWRPSWTRPRPTHTHCRERYTVPFSDEVTWTIFNGEDVIDGNCVLVCACVRSVWRHAVSAAGPPSALREDREGEAEHPPGAGAVQEQPEAAAGQDQLREYTHTRTHTHTLKPKTISGVCVVTFVVVVCFIFSCCLLDVSSHSLGV